MMRMRFGTMFDRGELVLVAYPFTDLSSKKRRPVMVIRSPDQQGDFIAMPVTSQSYHSNSLNPCKSTLLSKVITQFY